MPTVEAAKRVDEALAACGELAEMVTQAALKPDEHARMWETSKLLLRIQASDTSPTTVDALQVTAFELCCDYGWRDAGELRGEALRWLREVVRLRRAAALREHGDLLTVAGWLGLLVGCVEYDMGMRTVANASRAAALSLGEEAGNAEIGAWAWEMTAWFALTQGRFSEAIAAARAGQGLVGECHTVCVQLIGQEAKALARTGDVRAVREALDRGRHLLEKFPRPERPDHHFLVDPDKWDFYAMDAYRLAGDDERAEHHARQVLRLGTAADGTEKAPMRMAEARLTLGVASARAGELEQAVGMGMEAFRDPSVAALAADGGGRAGCRAVAAISEGACDGRLSGETAVGVLTASAVLSVICGQWADAGHLSRSLMCRPACVRSVRYPRRSPIRARSTVSTYADLIGSAASSTSTNTPPDLCG
jgi:hypothetical protein